MNAPQRILCNKCSLAMLMLWSEFVLYNLLVCNKILMKHEIQKQLKS